MERITTFYDVVFAVFALIAPLSQQFQSQVKPAGLVVVVPPIPGSATSSNSSGQSLQNVPLFSVSTKVIIRAYAISVTSALNYKNDGLQPVECEFVFPISDTAAVYDLSVKMGNKTLRTEVRNRTEAEEIYKSSVDAGQRASLLESQEGTPDVYRIVLGNLGVNERANVKISYAQLVDKNMDRIEVNLPVVMNPRYIPENHLSNEDVLSKHFHARVPYVAVSHIPYTFSFRASVDLGIGDRTIKAIQSANKTDVLTTSIDSLRKKADIDLVSTFVPDHDFRFTIYTDKKIALSQVYTEPGRRSNVSQQLEQPDWLAFDVVGAWLKHEGNLDLSPVPQSSPGDHHYWIIVDQSGSMTGEKIENAKYALILLIKSLPTTCKFNIIGFGSRFVNVFPHVVQYNRTNVDMAVQYANQMDATLGGTEILAPFQDVYSNPTPPNDKGRFIILLTDGEVSNTAQVVDIVRSNADTTFVFSLGIGEGASQALINEVARVSDGISLFVRDSNDRITEKVIRLLQATLQPIATVVSSTWQLSGGGDLAWIGPSITNNTVNHGQTFKQFAMIRRTAPHVTGVCYFNTRIKNFAYNLSINFSYKSNLDNTDDPFPLHRIAAKSRITELMDEYRTSKSEEVKNNIISISMATGVLSEFTAMVALDTTTNNYYRLESGGLIFITIPRPTIYDMTGFNPDLIGKAANIVPQASGFRGDWARKSGNGVDIDYNLFIGKQDSIDGFWVLNKEFVQDLKLPNLPTVRKLRRTARLALRPAKFNSSSLATLIGIAVLRNRYPDLQDEWVFIERKALSYLRTQGIADSLAIDNYVSTLAADLGIV